jgi:DNA-directed RNA polymerase specialized sigma24 family protein
VLVVAAAVPGDDTDDDSMVELIPIVRRVVAARARDPHQIEDLAQETVARVMAARHRIEPDTLAPYAVTIAKNLVTTAGRSADRDRRHAHLYITAQSGPGNLLGNLLCAVAGLLNGPPGCRWNGRPGRLGSAS